jgi:hypothetical protein
MQTDLEAFSSTDMNKLITCALVRLRFLAITTGFDFSIIIILNPYDWYYSHLLVIHVVAIGMLADDTALFFFNVICASVGPSNEELGIISYSFQVHRLSLNIKDELEKLILFFAPHNMICFASSSPLSLHHTL